MLLLTAGCAGPTTSGTPAANARPSAEPEASGPETDYQRKRRTARVKREQCVEIGNAIERAQQQDVILNVNDDKAMNSIAQSLDVSAEQITATSADLDELRAIRDEYGTNLQEMAAALRSAAQASSERARKPSIAAFHEREARSGTLIEKITEFCNAPVE